MCGRQTQDFQTVASAACWRSISAGRTEFMEVEMAKSNDRNLNVTIKNEPDDKDEVVISLAGIMRKLRKYFLPWIIIAAMLCVLLLGLNVVSTMRSKPPVTALVSFT